MMKVALYALGISGIVSGLVFSEMSNVQPSATLEDGQINFYQLRGAFLRIRKSESLSVCGRTKGSDICVETSASEASGSSVVFLNRGGHSYILTAEHVCSPARQSDMDMFINTPQDKEVLDTISNMTLTTSITRNVSYNIMNIYGRIAENIEIINTDINNDICIMRSDRIDGIIPVQISNTTPRIGEEVWNIAAPYGVFDFNMVPILRGVWGGQNPQGQAFICDLPASPGSSGSPVFNNDGELVSIVHSTHVQFNAASFGASLSNIRELINESLQ